MLIKRRSDPVYRDVRRRLLEFIRKSSNCNLVRQTTSSGDEVFWREFFIFVYRDFPLSTEDLRWDELLHNHGAMQAFSRIRLVLARKYGKPDLIQLQKAA